MAFDFRKEYKEFYMPKNKPGIVTMPSMNYIAVRGIGDPNQEDGEYKQAIRLLYGVAFTIKMSKKSDHQIDGYFDYVVPPLEGFWWQDGVDGIDYAHKEDFHWISVIRLPDFVTEEDFRWAVDAATQKKKLDFSKVEFLTVAEGLCVQCMHIGSYDDEPVTVAMMHEFIKQQGYELDITDKRLHHEIYLSDARKVAPEKLKTVIRHPIKARVKAIVETDRLFLREMNADDYDSMYQVLADIEIMKHYPYTFDEKKVREWIERNINRYKENGFGLWAVCLKKTGEMIGDCGLTLQNIGGEMLPEIGYHIRRDCQHKGYAKEAAKAVKDWAFKNTDYPALYSYCKYTNEASIKTAESIGMRFEREYPDEANGITHVSVIYREN